ncbi:hypothetical protein PAPYR_12381 [Paratrimastix pyriformis]|uniref:Uncharacterized protein n=1 Tax=Paratrimastix pyriformis TaxID=342808 RepID=A0ABQ8U1Y9_9EUKA|nr:hypothetical protein PAPYR_12381 [Paratrimastix pyriformis]
MARLREIFRKYSRNSYDVAGPLVEPPKEYMVASFIKEGPFGSLEVGKALVEFWRFAMLTRRCCLAAATELEEKEQPSPEVLRASLQDAVASSEMLLSRIEGIRKQRIGMAVKASELLAATPASAPTQGSLFTREELLEMEARVGLASQAKAKTLGSRSRKQLAPWKRQAGSRNAAGSKHPPLPSSAAGSNKKSRSYVPVERGLSKASPALAASPTVRQRGSTTGCSAAGK